jgi:hypothetical protein
LPGAWGLACIPRRPCIPEKALHPQKPGLARPPSCHLSLNVAFGGTSAAAKVIYVWVFRCDHTGKPKHMSEI